MSVLFAKWEAFWLALRAYWLLPILDPPSPDDNQRLDYELAQCTSHLFWPPMQLRPE